MKEDAYLEAQEIYSPLTGGIERINWTWEGGKVAFVGDRFISRMVSLGAMKRNGHIIIAGPYRLRLIQAWDFGWPAYYVMHDGWWARLREILYKFTGWLDIVYRKLILTCAVWGLADYQAGRVPAWEDIHILRKVFRK